MIYICGAKMSIYFDKDIPIEILGEIFDCCRLIDGIHLYVICKTFHSTFSLEYGKYTDILTYILFRIKDIRSSVFKCIKSLFKSPFEYIKSLTDNNMIYNKIIRLGYANDFDFETPIEYIIKKECLTLDRFSDSLIQQCIQIDGHTERLFGEVTLYLCLKHDSPMTNYVIEHSSGIIWDKDLWITLNDCLYKDFRYIIMSFLSIWTQNVVSISHLSEIVSIMGYEDILNYIYDEKNDQYILRGACLGGHLNIFKRIWDKIVDGRDSLNHLNYCRSIFENMLCCACSGGNIEILKILKPFMDVNNMNTYLDLAIDSHNCDIVEYLLSPFDRLPGKRSMYDIVEKYLYENLNQKDPIMNVESFCYNGYTDVVRLLICFGYKDESEYDDCSCGHRFKIYL
jgi:hypothetical protein